jgi:hypothetical protein
MPYRGIVIVAVRPGICKSYTMKRTKLVNMRVKVGVVVLALLIQALLPSFIHLAAPKNTYLAEICTAFGVKKIDIQDSGSGGASHGQCPICSVADALALPPALPSLHAPLLLGTEHPLSLGYSYHPITRLAVYLRGPPISA